VKKTFGGAIRSLSKIGRGPLGLLVMAVILGAATGAALAQDEGNAPAVDPAQATESADTSTSIPTTTDELATTTAADETTTAPEDVKGPESGSSDESTASDLTTTTSDDLNVSYQSQSVRDVKDPPTFAADCKEGGFGDEVTPPGTKTQVVDGVTLTFEFFQVPGGDTSSGVKVSASAPFTGEILIKSSTTDETHGLTITGTGHTVTFTSPSQNQNGVYQNISHVCVKGQGGTTSTTTGTTSTQTTSTLTTSTTSTLTTSTTTPSTTTTSTPSTTSTGSTAGTTAAGATQPAGVAGTTGGGGGGGKAPAQNQGVAAQAATSSGGGLPFTGLHAPILILMGLALAGAGFVLRRRLKDVS